MNFPRIKPFNFDINGNYIIPSIYAGRGDKIAIDLYGNYIFYKPLCEANNIRLPYGLRPGIRPIEEELRIELKNSIFTNFSVSSATDGINLPSFDTLYSIDSYTLQIGDLVLVKDQSNIEENGVYEVSDTGIVWKKLSNITNNLFIIPKNGFINKNKGFRLKIIPKQQIGFDPSVFSGPFPISKVPIYTEQEIETYVSDYFMNKSYGNIDWNNYGDMFSGYMSGLYEGRLLIVPTTESCITWLKKYEKISL